jgi:P pilus assembly chaperone PapD
VVRRKRRSRVGALPGWRAGFALAGVLVSAAVARAILVAPHHIFIDHRTRSAVLYLYNPTDRAEEVALSTAYGYPASDSAGNVFIRFVEEPGSDERSAAAWIRAFPRRARVEPGQRQAVRLLAEPPPDLPDGEYWTRLVVASRPAEVPVAEADTGVRVGVVLEVRTIVPVTYRKGEVRTGVELTRIDAVPEGDSLAVRVGMRRAGNAAFLGTLYVALEDSTGAVRAATEQQVAVYHELLRRVALPLAGVRAGTYHVRVRLESRRTDLDPRDVLPAQPAEGRVAVRLP